MAKVGSKADEYNQAKQPPTVDTKKLTFEKELELQIQVLERKLKIKKDLLDLVKNNYEVTEKFIELYRSQ